ncbi:MAG: UDP-N-acetylmuramoyl-tripeptide--D-alanyl-D-alanine ligase [Xanthomonadaceae bacterium]|jgi:UDP-N-acetylmuramoyl-tripeptide--D-alanyl-D-alanine ligase|nr:UDP-N-acetylmuramoyl-tripeptide--D-alanyl-D-alanine ligase [Xanthomonadaceae bacterium]
MRPVPLSLIAHWAGGELHGEDVMIASIAHDTRTLTDDSLYVALRGERFDGHDFAVDAEARGATALLVERRLTSTLPQIRVVDTQRALADIAASMQRDRPGKVVALTGSNGKTSVKALVMSILRLAGNAYANPGNRNNEIGLPLAVIDAPDDADFAVYEMGAGKPGDIVYLTGIVRPDVALVNNIAPAHLQRMHSLLGIAGTKGAIYSALPAQGTAVVNADEPFGLWFEQACIGTPASQRRIHRFGLDHSADVRARALRPRDEGTGFILMTPRGEAEVRLRLPGRHNVRNALAATAVALACDVPLATIVEGLNAAEPVPGRQIAHALKPGVTLIDDSYNANPGSLAAAIETLAAYPGECWLVLGDMRELGLAAEALHAQAGRHARAAGINRLYALGPLSVAAAHAFGAGGRSFDMHAALLEALGADLAGAGPVRVLIKGSRGSAMDRIVAGLLAGGEHSHVA